ncbi:MAG: hypothetical protein LBS10_10250 [Gracilibacteraceae bacterium]|jgi:hypothetical protein|nr:hypothetical protein [Gracilibacteraceae bacterium]
MLKKNKVIYLLLALLLALSLSACGQSPAAAPSQPSGSPAAQPPAGQPEPATPSAPVAEEVKGVTIPAFTVLVNGVEVNQDAVAAYPMYSVQAVSVNSSGTESNTTYVGFAMKDVLAAAGLTEAYVWVQAIASDGYAVTLSEGIVMEDTTLLAVTKDGSPFSASPWFAPCSSTTTGNYLMATASILVNTTEGAPEIEVTPPAGGGGPEASSGDLPEILDRTGKVEFAPYSFKFNGTEVTNETLAGLSIYKITATTVNNNGDTVESGYTGYKLADVLETMGAGAGVNVKAVASDGFESTLTADMVASDYTLVAIEKDKETGEGGTVWVAPCAQKTAGSFVKLVAEIVAQ